MKCSRMRGQPAPTPPALPTFDPSLWKGAPPGLIAARSLRPVARALHTRRSQNWKYTNGTAAALAASWSPIAITNSSAPCTGAGAAMNAPRARS
jgi:hypothetical protein